MNKLILPAMLCALGANTAIAQNNDSLRVAELTEVMVKGVKTSKDTPFAVANIDTQQLGTFAKTGRELPMLFAQTPGVVAWGENGLGIGTTYMRIRGAAGSRINVTIDGVQLNSPEDQCVFWANMNSYAALLGSAQIQRGVGTSTNGDGAFGGSIALTTKNPSTKPTLEVTGSYGSYNTWNAGGQFSTGLLWKHLIVNGAYHHTATDGFMHGTQGKAGSYLGGLTWLGKDFVITYKNIGNYEHMGQAWNGVDTGDLLDGNYGTKTGLNTYADFWKAGLGQYNSLYEYMNDPYDPTAGTSRYTMNDGSLWSKTTDNFWQNHNILSVSANISRHWKTSASLHYTYGYGYYEEFKGSCKLSKFGIADMTLSDGSTLKKTDFVRKKGLDQHAMGFVWTTNYKDRISDIVGGLSAQTFKSNHFGHLNYIANNELSAKLLHNGTYTYYDSDASKGDLNVFIKATEHITPWFDAFADLQYRYVEYITNGKNDKFYRNADGTYTNQRLDINETFHFFNPKVGVNFHTGGHRAYASFAVSNREPERNNYTDNGSYPLPKAERLYDTELGYSYSGKNWNAGINAYYMKYDNQLVQTGEVSDIGEALTTNVKDSYRMGIEITAGWQPWKCLDIYGNAALSKNKIKNFDEVVEDWDNYDTGTATFHYDNSTLAFSPSAILNGFVTFHKWGLNVTWHTNFVSKQYVDNTQCEQRSLPSYTQSNLSATYTFDFSRRHIALKEITIGASLNNVFDAHYAASAWVYSAIYASGGHTNDNRYRQMGLMPMAGRHFMTSLTVKF